MPMLKCKPQVYQFCRYGKEHTYKNNKKNKRLGIAGKTFKRYSIRRVAGPKIIKVKRRKAKQIKTINYPTNLEKIYDRLKK